ncbi:MAG: hypothetical protein LUH58_00425 [Lachnospiraceae bacterium]|nr:hypothetical protein [Lachnospiraceae bacterium]
MEKDNEKNTPRRYEFGKLCVVMREHYPEDGNKSFTDLLSDFICREATYGRDIE